MIEPKQLNATITVPWKEIIKHPLFNLVRVIRSPVWYVDRRVFTFITTDEAHIACFNFTYSPLENFFTQCRAWIKSIYDYWENRHEMMDAIQGKEDWWYEEGL